MNSIPSLYLLLSNYSKEEIDNAIKKLTIKEQTLLYFKYGKDLNHLNTTTWKVENQKNLYHVIAKLKRIINGEKRGICYSNGKVIKTIYQIFNMYSKEDIDYIISLLPKEDKDILYLRYGADLEEPNISCWDKSYDNKFKRIIFKIKHLLEDKKLGKDIIIPKSRILTIYQIFRNYSKEEVDNVLITLNEYEKNLLYLRYGTDLENPTSSFWKKEYYVEFYNKLIPRIKTKLIKNRRIKNEIIKINNYNKNSKIGKIIIEINKELLEKENNILIDKFSKEEILLYILVQRMDDSYSLNDLEEFFEIDRKYILKIVKNILNETINLKCLIKK